jgi:hypothetical protein
MTPDQVYPIFVKWYASPVEERNPKTIPAFCEHMGIELADTVDYTSRESFSEDLYKAAKEWGKSKIPELLHMLYNKYKLTNNANDLRMYKDLLELDKDSKNAPIINLNVFNPTDDQYRNIIARENRALFERESEVPTLTDGSA